MNGQLEFIQSLSIDEGKRLISYFKYLANMDTGEKRKPQSGASDYILRDGQRIELRFSTLPSVLLLESLVIRILKQQFKENQTLATYFPNMVAVLRHLVGRKSGLLLFSGPVGSGKTTTIYQLLRERLHDESLQIITMEDPVEMYESKFLQVEVNERAGIGYDTIIRASLRHHPDVLMIGEIRDEDTARMAIRGALTGHLMIATIHAKNTLGVVGRLQELQITDEQLRQTLIGISTQRLIPRYCPRCNGACHFDCQYYAGHQKRMAMYEILTGKELKAVLDGNMLTNMKTLNHHLRKAYALGYIDEKTYDKFEMV